MKYIFLIGFLFSNLGLLSQTTIFQHITISSGIGSGKPDIREFFSGLFASQSDKTICSSKNIIPIHATLDIKLNNKISIGIGVHTQNNDKWEHYPYVDNMLFGQANHNLTTINNSKSIHIYNKIVVYNQSDLFVSSIILGICYGHQTKIKSSDIISINNYTTTSGGFIAPNIYWQNTAGHQLKGYLNIGYGAAGIITIGASYLLKK
jgi:hypothetical protein